MNPRRCRRGSCHVIVIALMLACAWPALTFADCGWILWLKIKTTRLELDKDSKGVIEPGTWEPRQGFALLAECRTAAIAERKSNKKAPLTILSISRSF
jgi:hypothetical protein